MYTIEQHLICCKLRQVSYCVEWNIRLTPDFRVHGGTSVKPSLQERLAIEA